MIFAYHTCKALYAIRKDCSVLWFAYAVWNASIENTYVVHVESHGQPGLTSGWQARGTT